MNAGKQQVDASLLIHSHSCCEIRLKEVSLLCDPWLFGSCYWRSWWNFPRPEALESLLKVWKQKKLVLIYITHLHWDHFHGPTLKRLASELGNIRFLIPKTPESRLHQDLALFAKSIPIDQLIHAKNYNYHPFNLVSFQQGIAFADSTLAIKVGQDWIWNMNDCKLTNHSLKHLSSIAGRPKYALRSHSSANWRSCIRGKSSEDLEAIHDKSLKSYSHEFFQSCYSTGASMAIPFASNVACLHRDTFQYNKILNFSDYVERDFSDCSDRFGGMRVQLLLPGESLDIVNDSLLSKNDSFREAIAVSDREELLKDYQNLLAGSLSIHYDKEISARIKWSLVNRYFSGVIRSTPLPLRWYLGKLIHLEIVECGVSYWVCLDFRAKKVIPLDHLVMRKRLIVFKVSAFVLNDVCAKSHWNSLGVSKLLEIYIDPGEKRHEVFGLLCCAYESGGAVPLSNVLRPRFFVTWLRRYRECLDLFALAFKVFASDGYKGSVR